MFSDGHFLDNGDDGKCLIICWLLKGARKRSRAPPYTAPLNVASLSGISTNAFVIRKHGSYHFANRRPDFVFPDSWGSLVLLFHVRTFGFYDEPMSSHRWNAFQKVFAVNGILLQELNGICHSLCFVEMSCVTHRAHTFWNRNCTFILDTVPHDRFKSCVSWYTVTSLFSNMASSPCVLFTAVPAVVVLPLRGTSLERFKILHTRNCRLITLSPQTSTKRWWISAVGTCFTFKGGITPLIFCFNHCSSRPSI